LKSFLARVYVSLKPTVNDPQGEIRADYRVALRPLSYFIDTDGILRAIQVGEVTAEGFEQKYALIRPGAPAGSAAPSAAPAAPTGG